MNHDDTAARQVEHLRHLRGGVGAAGLGDGKVAQLLQGLVGLGQLQALASQLAFRQWTKGSVYLKPVIVHLYNNSDPLVAGRVGVTAIPPISTPYPWHILRNHSNQ